MYISKVLWSAHSKVLCPDLRRVCYIERNLREVAHMPRLKLGNIRDINSANKKSKKRRGSKTQGKGHKGQGQRGGKPRVGFEGGQTPFYLKVPKHGLALARPEFDFTPLHLNKIQYFLDAGRIDPNQKLDMRTMLRSGMCAVTNLRDGVKLYHDGHTWFQGKIHIECSQATPEAIEAIERNGGTVTTVYHTRQSLEAHIKPHKYLHPPRLDRPDQRHIEFYTDPANRGFLANPIDVQRLRQKNLDLGPIAAQLQQLRLEDEVD